MDRPMIDPVGAKQQDASALRAQAPQGVSPFGEAADLPGPVAGGSAVGPGDLASDGGPYYSPVVRLDAETQRTVIMFRDISTGKVQTQYPSERQLEAYRASLRQQKAQDEELASGGGRSGGAEAQTRTGGTPFPARRGAVVEDLPVAEPTGTGRTEHGAIAAMTATDVALAQARPRMAAVTA